ncbi:glucose sensor KNAG_0C03990 [Huiozyma naganishii CBS 8797]|uniref:Major facilitator superfamily (MFS) profile domain-containing protein n=1 Tax=Huiozyma naganishii (strain ATCC MYA-139 / BCRC 22969 / CBS 8797 / KCTC 17520 / NBRC 10181 / NCYC 3082 / Yp74L-3) TaxID=1071383 RepID=J7RJ23_HUIN7|nr:hypothetical protein KNAG_0C03990 [Kazachstania naganishii CBS 8797]CCK69503.1 hypothetical protein KNAG_0C03990 [Kazachstania naganishii CBS 8797]
MASNLDGNDRPTHTGDMTDDDIYKRDSAEVMELQDFNGTMKNYDLEPDFVHQRTHSVGTFDEQDCYDEGDSDAVYIAQARDTLNQPFPLRSKVMSFCVGLFVAVGGFLFGYDTGLINSLTDMQMFQKNMAPDHTSFTNSEFSILVSFLSLGTFFGALVAPWIAGKYGRKPTIIFSTAVIFTIGNSLQVAAHSLRLLVAGRVISGFGIGIISAVVPLYQAEAAEKSLRGAIISSYQWSITIGLLISNAVSQRTYGMQTAAAYRIPIGLQYVWSAILAVGMVFLPESPRFYVLKDQLIKAGKSLSFLRGVPIEDPRLLEELVEIKATYDYEASFGRSSIWDCFRSSENRPKQELRMFTGIAIQAFQQFSGINFIFYYGSTFFKNTGINNHFTVSLITYAVNVAFNVPGMFFVEYFGRRKVLLVGGVLIATSNFLVAIVGTTLHTNYVSKIVIAFVCFFIASFSASWGGVVWVISAELFPLGVREKCTAICAAVNWLSNFVCALIIPYIINTRNTVHISAGCRIFFIWGPLNALGTIIVYFTVYETSGLRLEEITELYRNSKNCFDSVRCNKILRERPIVMSAQPMVNMLHDLQARNTHDHPRPSVSPSAAIPRNSIHGGAPFGRAPDRMSLSTDDVDPHFSHSLYRRHSKQSQDGNYATEAQFEEEDLGQSKDLDITQNIVDLGNGLGLNTYKRGPPSILTESSIDDGDLSYTGDSATDGKHSTTVNEYMANLTSSTASNGASSYSSFYANHRKTGDTSSGQSEVDWSQFLSHRSEASSSRNTAEDPGTQE